METKEPTPDVFQRLPKYITPLHYALLFEPKWNEPTFDGVATIRLRIDVETCELALHALEIRATEIEYEDELTKTKVLPKEFFLNEHLELLTISFNPALNPGLGILKITFSGNITDNMKGLYRTQYKKGEDGQLFYNYVTHFEPTLARRCFPCVDEPAVKATFDITLVVPKDLVALSNMPQKDDKPHKSNPELKVISFDRTPVMSTYLVAFVVGEFKYIEDVKTVVSPHKAVSSRVYTPVGKQKQGAFALDIAMKSLRFYEEYFGVPYSLPKMDLVAVGDFPCGAMENWGLIIFRDTRLLVDTSETSSFTKQQIALIVSHEVAHNFFGNLVTMMWWKELWLKEGFATFIEYLCVENFFPEYDIWTQFATDIFTQALGFDALKNSHPVEVDVEDPSDIDEIFDNISYDKGASIIRMLYHYLGDEDFRIGMNLYLTTHQYKNAETADLWSALAQGSGKPVGYIMPSWTVQMGFPLVTVVEAAHTDSNEIVLLIKQEKFWANWRLYRDEFRAESECYKWVIPLTICKKSRPTEIICTHLFDGGSSKTMKIVVPNVGRDEWVKLNVGNVGYFRVRYPEEMLMMYLSAIKDKTMLPLDRLGLLDDLFAVIRSGYNSVVDIFILLEAYFHEDNYTVWATIRDIMIHLNILLARTDLLEKFNSFGQKLFTGIEETVGWDRKDGESHTTTMLRSLVLSRLMSFGNKSTITEANIRFNMHVSGVKMIPADLRQAVYRSVLLEGGEDKFNIMLKLYHDSEMSEEKLRILQAFGAIRDKQLLRKVLQFSISDDVKTQDTVLILESLSHTKEGQDLNWEFFKENYKLFQKRFPGGMIISRLVKTVAENFTTEEMALEVEDFFSAHYFRGTYRTVQQAIESIRINEAWLKRDLESIREYLSPKNI